MSSNNLARLSRAVLERRNQLGLTQDELALAGGPSNTTTSAIEKGTATTVSPSTMKKLDRGLQWERGSARRVYTGEGDPVPAVGGATQTPDYVAAPGARVEGGVTNEDLLRELVAMRAQYDQLQAGQEALSRRVEKLEQSGS